jgi:N4-gp56 family major capsid protein
MAEKAMMTTSRVEHPVNVYYQKKVLTRVLPALVFQQWGQQDKIPQHEGATSKWRRWSNLTAQTTPAQEGQDTAPVLISKTDVTATVSEYEAWTKISSWMKFTGLAQDQDNIADVLLDNMALTIDTLCRDVIRGCANSVTCSNGSGTATYINKTDIDTCVNNMLGWNAKMITGQINAGSGQGTSPIRAAFIGIGHPLMRPRLEAVSGFKHVSNYAGQGGVYPNEFCTTGDVRWLLTTNCYNDGTYYNSPIIAKDFFGNVQIEGNSADKPLIYTPPERTGSPGQRYAMLAYVFNYVAKILNENFGYVIKSTV